MAGKSETRTKWIFGGFHTCDFFLLRFGLLLAQSSYATVIISSYPNNSGGLRNLDHASTGGAFTMGPASFQLDTVTFQIDFIASAPGSALQVGLYGDGGSGNPTGAPLVTFTPPSGTFVGINDSTLLPASPFTLQALTAYWLVLYTEVTQVGATLSSVAPAGAFATSVGYSTGSGTTVPNSSDPRNFLLYEVDGTQIVSGPTAAPGAGYVRFDGRIVNCSGRVELPGEIGEVIAQLESYRT